MTVQSSRRDLSISRWSASRVDLAFAAVVLFLGSKYLVQLGIHSQTWLLCYVVFLGLIATRFAEFVSILRANSVYLLYPLLCLASVLWSDSPSASLRISVQISMSILMAIYIGARLGTRRLLFLLLAVSSTGLFLSWINLSGVFFDAFDHNRLFTGVFQSKNALGEGATNFALCAMAVLMLVKAASWRSKGVVIAMSFLVLSMLFLAKSASGLVLTIGGFLGVFSAALLYRGPVSRSVFLFVMTVILAVGATYCMVYGINPWIETLKALGKNTTLTGRTDLWDYGLALFWQNPILGIGIDGFWSGGRHTNFILAFQSFHGAGVLSFHNLIVEMLVAFGIFGPLVHLMIGYTTVRRGLINAVSGRNPLGIWVVMLAVIYYVQSMVGTTLVKPHEVNFMILVAAGASLSGYRPADRD